MLKTQKIQIKKPGGLLLFFLNLRILNQKVDSAEAVSTLCWNGAATQKEKWKVTLKSQPWTDSLYFGLRYLVRFKQGSQNVQPTLTGQASLRLHEVEILWLLFHRNKWVNLNMGLLGAFPKLTVSGKAANEVQQF